MYTSLVAFVWAFVIMFSEEAYGENLLESLHQNYWAKTSLKIAAGMSLFLYLFDVEMWEGTCGKIWRFLMLGALGFFVFLAVIFQAGERPSAPRSRTAAAAAETYVGRWDARGAPRATRGRCGRRRAQVIEATRGRPGDAVEGGGVLREERERRE